MKLINMIESNTNLKEHIKFFNDNNFITFRVKIKDLRLNSRILKNKPLMSYINCLMIMTNWLSGQVTEL